LPLIPLTLVFMFMKNGPRSPLIIPIIKQPGITASGTVTSGLSTPNLRELSLQSTGFWCRSASSTPSVNTAVEQVKKTFQRTSNFQNGLARLNSYKNKAPPIGAPNAILTPADAPAAMSYLFL